MKFIEDTKKYFGMRAIRIRSKDLRRNVRTCSIEDAKKIGILFNATHQVSFEIVKDLVKSISSKNNHVEVLGFVDSKQLVDHYLYRKGFEFFTRNQLNWYHKPVEEIVEKFIDTEFDLLLDLSLDNPFPVKYILACSKARFKAGKFEEGQEYLDFMIDIEKEKSAMNHIKKELGSDYTQRKTRNSEMEKIVNLKAQTEIQLNFLINQLTHYLALLKNQN